MAEYPSAQRQNKWFAARFLKLLIKEAIAPEISADGYLFLSIVAYMEDDTHYRRPVRFWDEQIGDRIGCSRYTVQRLKKRLIEAGWLHYENRANRKQGEYWVTIPDEFRDSFAEIYYTGAAALPSTEEGVYCGSPATITAQEPHNSRTITAQEPHNSRTITAHLQTVTNNQLPVNNKREVAKATSGSPKPKKKFESEDLETAKQLLAAIRQRKPKTTATPSRLEGWANDIRLLRTKDKNTTDEIREVIAWLPSHEGRGGFAWGDNVQSGKKLREHFASLHAAMGKPELARQPAYQPWEGEARPEDDIAPF